MFSSTGDPQMISEGTDQFQLSRSERVDVRQMSHAPHWIESAWLDPEDGALYGWYHHEPGGVCKGSSLTTPKIGAVVSYDNGRTVTDLGIILESGDAPNCSAKNGFFAGGHGDLSVILDRQRRYFYFYFTNYGGAGEEQGVAAARMAFRDRRRPAGAVYKYYRTSWNEPGIGGHLTPIFKARHSWQEEKTDSFWGPAVHWNSHLQKFVMLLNRSCCEPGWPQEGIYYAFASFNLAEPLAWSWPAKLLDRDDLEKGPGYYPQVFGFGRGNTDSHAGRTARLYVQGESTWELEFQRPAAPGAGAVVPGPGEVGTPLTPPDELTELQLEDN